MTPPRPETATERDLLNPWPRPGGRTFAVGVGLLVIYGWALSGTDVSPAALADGVPGAADFVGRLFPPVWRLVQVSIGGYRLLLPEAVVAIAETLQMALVGTSIAVVIAIPLALLAARTTSPHRAVYQVTRLLLNLLRSIPDVILALLFVAAVGLGPFAGVMALALGGLGFLGKQYAEAIEAVDPKPILAIESTGASRAQTFVYAVVPQALPLFVSYSLLVFESSVRSATVLGIVGAGGVGFMLSQYVALFRYRELMGALIVIILAVTVIDRASDALRRRLT